MELIQVMYKVSAKSIFFVLAFFIATKRGGGQRFGWVRIMKQKYLMGVRI